MCSLVMNLFVALRQQCFCDDDKQVLSSSNKVPPCTAYLESELRRHVSAVELGYALAPSQGETARERNDVMINHNDFKS